MEKHKYALRAARDTLMSQLGLASSRPLLNVPVRVEEPVVRYGNHTWVAIAFSQPDVYYELRDSAGGTVGGQQGNGAAVRLKTSALVEEDYRFSVWASRRGEGMAASAGGPLVQLLETVAVRVGLDTALDISLQNKVVDFGAKTTVVVHSAQSRVRYELLDEATLTPLGDAVETKDSGDVALPTRPLTEDTTVVVRATNPKTGLSDLLTQRPQVQVRPDVALVATATPTLVDYNGLATIRLAGSQLTASYQLQLENASLDATLAPPAATAPVPGTGKALMLTTGALAEDCRARIMVIKAASGLADELTVQLLIPARPDPDKKLSLVKDLTEEGKGKAVRSVVAGTAAVIKVANTQRGVRYQLRIGSSDVGPPAYHHINAGIGQARVGIELAIDAFNDAAVYLPTGVLDETTEFSVFAFKPTRVQEGVEVGTISVAVRPERA